MTGIATLNLTIREETFNRMRRDGAVVLSLTKEAVDKQGIKYLSEVNVRRICPLLKTPQDSFRARVAAIEHPAASKRKRDLEPNRELTLQVITHDSRTAPRERRD